MRPSAYECEKPKKNWINFHIFRNCESACFDALREKTNKSASECQLCKKLRFTIIACFTYCLASLYFVEVGLESAQFRARVFHFSFSQLAHDKVNMQLHGFVYFWWATTNWQCNSRLTNFSSSCISSCNRFVTPRYCSCMSLLVLFFLCAKCKCNFCVAKGCFMYWKMIG